MIRPRSIVLPAISMILVLACATTAYAAPQGARGMSKGPTVNLVAASKGCAVVHIALHGVKAPTITCLRRTRATNLAGRTGNAITPSTPGGAPCNVAGVTLQIVTYEEDEFCWTGTGYLGLSPTIPQVAVISAVDQAWVRLYMNGAGTFFNAASGGVNEFFFSPEPDPQNITVSQIGIGSYHA